MTANFGRQCLLARRFAERGVRFVQVTHSDSNVQWDQHGKLKEGHAKNAREVDRPIAGLLKDLKASGLLQDTLVLWGGEFGRTPTAEGTDGRDHNPEGFTMWMAGGGVKAGIKLRRHRRLRLLRGRAAMHIHDVHATILHLLGLDHERLTYRYAGRDFRLTDVAGQVAREISPESGHPHHPHRGRWSVPLWIGGADPRPAQTCPNNFRLPEHRLPCPFELSLSRTFVPRKRDPRARLSRAADPLLRPGA